MMLLLNEQDALQEGAAKEDTYNGKVPKQANLKRERVKTEL